MLDGGDADVCSLQVDGLASHEAGPACVQNVTAATAAAQAAAALGQLAAALAGQAPMEPTAVVAAPVTGAAQTCSFSCFMQNPGTSAELE